jgi:Arginase family
VWWLVRHLSGELPLDWRVLLSGYFPEYAYELGSLDTSLPFAELKARSLINDQAHAADQDPDFSARIREGLPRPPARADRPARRRAQRRGDPGVFRAHPRHGRRAARGRRRPHRAAADPARDRPGRAVGLIQFDAHSDVFDAFMGSKINHATFVRRGIEEGLIEPGRSVQVGLRGTRYGSDDLDYSRAAGIRVITIDDYEELGRARVTATIREVVGSGPVYLTYDVDGLDPTEAPGTGVPGPGGLSMRDSQVVVRGLTGLDVIGGDVCEVAPPLDPSGITCIAAANLMFEILCLIATARAARRAD